MHASRVMQYVVLFSSLVAVSNFALGQSRWLDLEATPKNQAGEILLVPGSPSQFFAIAPKFKGPVKQIRMDKSSSGGKWIVTWEFDRSGQLVAYSDEMATPTPSTTNLTWKDRQLVSVDRAKAGSFHYAYDTHRQGY